ncbi:MAG: hypothetical protein GXP45_07555 [bacterium]|nr:hypothetical protein [bacterium]
MKQTNKKFLVTSLLTVATMATIGSAFAFNGGNNNRPQIDDTTRTSIQTAITNKDYQGFLTAVSNLPQHPEVSEEQFNKILKKKTTREQHKTNAETRKAKMMKIMDDADYSAWQEMAPDQMKNIIDSEIKFQKLVEAHQYMQKAQTIREELGLPDMHEHQRMMNKAMFDQDEKNMMKQESHKRMNTHKQQRENDED